LENNKNILVIFGARIRGINLLKRLTNRNSFEGVNELYQIDEICFYDNDESIWNTHIENVRVISFEELNALDRNKTKILIASQSYIDILAQCDELGFWRIKHLNDENYLVYTDPKAISMILDIGNPIPDGYLGSDQWSEAEENELNHRIYNDLIIMNDDEIKESYPHYWERLLHTISFATGNVLEIGCGRGNITKYLIENEKVQTIYACDMYGEPLELMRKSNFYDENRIKIVQNDIAELSFDNNLTFDTVMLSEIIEHISLSKETSFLNNIRKNLNPSNSCFVISTPIGFMPDPTHLRGFSKNEFIKHIERYYGIIKDIHYTKIQQIAFGYFK